MMAEHIEIEEIDGTYRVTYRGYTPERWFRTQQSAESFVRRYGDSLKRQVVRALAELRRSEIAQVARAIEFANRAIRTASCEADGHGYWRAVPKLDGGYHVCDSCGAADFVG